MLADVKSFYTAKISATEVSKADDEIVTWMWVLMKESFQADLEGGPASTETLQETIK